MSTDQALFDEVGAALEAGGQWGLAVDADWRIRFVSTGLRRMFGWRSEPGAQYFGRAWVDDMMASPFGSNTIDQLREIFASLGPMMLVDLGSRERVRQAVDDRLADLVDDLVPDERSVTTLLMSGAGIGQDVSSYSLNVRLRDDAGRSVGTMFVNKPGVDMGTLAQMAINSDPGHLDRIQRVVVPARRPAAVLFADLEGSSPLSKRLPTATYFALARRLVRAADAAVVEAGGLVGRHVGDGVAAFFLAETAGSESAAAAACITAARSLIDRVPEVARRSDLDPDDIVVRMGLHWGSTLYVGNITSVGRSEVTAMGDAVNEAARIEACAAGGRTLASKELVERLDDADAGRLDIDPMRVQYTPLVDLPTATEKARRDAPAIAVCDLRPSG